MPTFSNLQSTPGDISLGTGHVRLTAGESAGPARGSSSRRPHGTAQVQPRQGALESARTARIPPAECGRNRESVAPQMWQGQARRTSRMRHTLSTRSKEMRAVRSGRNNDHNTADTLSPVLAIRHATPNGTHYCNMQRPAESAQQAPERPHPRWAWMHLSPRHRRGINGPHRVRTLPFGPPRSKPPVRARCTRQASDQSGE